MQFALLDSEELFRMHSSVRLTPNLETHVGTSFQQGKQDGYRIVNVTSEFQLAFGEPDERVIGNRQLGFYVPRSSWKGVEAVAVFGGLQATRLQKGEFLSLLRERASKSGQRQWADYYLACIMQSSYGPDFLVTAHWVSDGAGHYGFDIDADPHPSTCHVYEPSCLFVKPA